MVGCWCGEMNSSELEGVWALGVMAVGWWLG
jgi:hypothetical protein